MYLAPSNYKIMNKFKFYFILLSTLLVIFSSCNKDDDQTTTIPLNDFATQRDTDKKTIETYLKTHKLNTEITDYAKNVNSSNLLLDTSTESESLWSLKESTTYPKLKSKQVFVESQNSITYTVYYLVFNEGSTTEKPCPLDEILVTYRGTSLKYDSGVSTATEFENSPVSTLFTLNTVISGWQEIFPMFGKGIFDEPATGNGPNVYTDYGAGLMFIPSGLAYFNGSRNNIPSYSPLVFSFQMFNFKRVDNDFDGIMSVDEIVRKDDGSFTYTDTDGDGIKDIVDQDDDNDGFSTLNERKYKLSLQQDPLQKTYYYPYNGANVDDPTTLNDERKGIPDCSLIPDYTSSTRIRKHLTKDCH